MTLIPLYNALYATMPIFCGLWGGARFGLSGLLIGLVVGLFIGSASIFVFRQFGFWFTRHGKEKRKVAELCLYGFTAWTLGSGFVSFFTTTFVIHHVAA